MGGFNLLNMVSQLALGIDANAGMRALWLVVGVCLSAKPCLVAMRKFERGLLVLLGFKMCFSVQRQ